MPRFAPAVVALLFVAGAAVAQTAPPQNATDLPPAGAMTTLTAPPPVTTSYASGDGLTVSMLNGESTLRLFGQFSTLAVANTDRGFPAGAPLFLLPPPASGNPTNTFDINARQTAFGAAFTGPPVVGFTPAATVLVFIQNDSLTSDAYGLLPYNVFAELRNDDWRFAAGLMSDVFNPGNPTTIPLLKLFFSGNTGSFAGALRAEHFYKPDPAFQLTTQVALRKPIASVVTSNQRLIEDNGWPNVEGRVAAGLGAVEELAGGRKLRWLEVGVSGVVGQLRNGTILAPTNTDLIARSTITVWGLGADVQAALTERFGLAGEFFVGQGLGEYNGGIGQTFGRNLQAIRTAGGWGEAYYYVTDQLHVHTGYGIDAPGPRRPHLDPTRPQPDVLHERGVGREQDAPARLRGGLPQDRLHHLPQRRRAGVHQPVPVEVLTLPRTRGTGESTERLVRPGRASTAWRGHRPTRAARSASRRRSTAGAIATAPPRRTSQAGWVRRR